MILFLLISLDPCVIVNETKNYYDFLIKLQKEVPKLTEYECKVLTMLSQEILNGKRKHEIMLIKYLLINKGVTKKEWKDILAREGCLFKEETLASVEGILDLTFFTQAAKKKYGEVPLVVNDDYKYRFNDRLSSLIEKNSYFKFLIEDIIKCAENKTLEYDSSEKLTLYQNIHEKMHVSCLIGIPMKVQQCMGINLNSILAQIFVTYIKMKMWNRV